MTSGAGAPSPFTSQPRSLTPSAATMLTSSMFGRGAGRESSGRGKNSIRSWKNHMNSGTPMATPSTIFTIEPIISVELDARLGAAFEETRQGIERDADRAVERVQVHLVQRQVHQPREPALDAVALAREKTHQRSDRAVFPERHKSTEVAVVEGRERLPAHALRHRPEKVGSLLVRSLRGGRHGPRLAFAQERRAVAQGENVGIPRRLQSRLDDELVDPVGFESVEVPEEICPFDSRGPDREVRGVGFATLGLHLVRRDLDGLLGAPDTHTQVFEGYGHGLGNALGEHRQDSRVGVEQGDVKEPLGIYV